MFLRFHQNRRLDVLINYVMYVHLSGVRANFRSEPRRGGAAMVEVRVCDEDGKVITSVCQVRQEAQMLMLNPGSNGLSLSLP